MITDISLPFEKVKIFCQKWGITEFALFGSVLRDDFNVNSSDIGVLVTFDPAVRHHFADFLEMEAELTAIFGRKVDLGERRAVETNYIRRKAILESAQVIYAR